MRKNINNVKTKLDKTDMKTELYKLQGYTHTHWKNIDTETGPHECSSDPVYCMLQLGKYTHTKTHTHTQSASVVVNALGSQPREPGFDPLGRRRLFGCVSFRVASVHLAVSRYGM